MSEAASRLGRILKVLPLFERRDEISHEELVRIAGIPIETVIEDLRALTSRQGDPGGFVESIGIEIQSDRIAIRSTHLLRPLRLSATEVSALELGIAMLAQVRPPDELSVIERTRTKVHRLRSAALPDTAPTDFHNEITLPRDGAVAETLLKGYRQRRAVAIEYQSSTAAAATERTIYPYAIVATHGTWFVVAHCTRANAMRLFRADRIATARLEDFTFEIPSDLSEVLQLYRKPFLGDPEAELVVRYSARIAPWIAEREGIPIDADGSVTVRHPLADEGWAIRHVLQYADEAEVLAPPRIRRAILQRLKKMRASIRRPGANAARVARNKQRRRSRER